MKISEVIKMLQSELARNGDLEVKFEYDGSAIDSAYPHDNALYLDS